MSMRNRINCLGVVAAVLLSTASLAHATMYKWTDEEGRVTYSNIPPPEPGKARSVTVIDNIPTPATAKVEAAAPSPSPSPSPFVETSPGAATVQPPATARAEQLERTYNRPIMPAAVQDPCLRSPDPNCYWRNKDRYHPYLGYAPDATARGAGNRTPATATASSSGAAAVGATTGSGGGSVAGGSNDGTGRSAPLGTPAIEVRTR